MPFEPHDMELVVQQDGPVVQVTMNRPGALNALSLEMIRMFAAGLKSWEEDDSVKAVIITGAGDRAFCAGGDVKATYRTGMSYRRGDIDPSVITLFYGEEYLVNRQLFHFKKPLFAFMDGITMGGGFGIAGPCAYRIASEKTVFAMPETIIGFFPDVGCAHYLNQCPDGIGLYLGLTGNRLGAADMLACGLATHFVPSAGMYGCQERLIAALKNGSEAIEDVLMPCHIVPDEKPLLDRHKDMIRQCFEGQDSVEAVIAALQESGDDWAAAQAEALLTRSPTSLKVTLEHLRRATDMDFDAITAQDYILAGHFMRGHDFYEGVRAQLIDKDRQPQWVPDSLDKVDNSMVEDYFSTCSVSLDEIAAE
ncbi:MAG: enoyl-CoA hydratase/isomerase family protein [Rhodospirillales bacterium]|nr:enoyl-CoA hydratase/isomerase family protein [Rhodospirillales bacterium]MCB9995499.1 enoyl-CoA hydratase/isomerase family protein [Rhodospirillales bacterium]